MAKGGYTLFCLFLLLSALPDFALGQDAIGAIILINNADYDINFKNEVGFVDGQKQIDPGFTPLSKGSAWSMTVVPSTEVVITQFTMNAPTPNNEVLLVWSTIPGAVAIPCTDCFWTIDNQGFSVGASKDGPKTFIAGWRLGWR